jgi:DNA-binding MarR family transcriptional regulator
MAKTARSKTADSDAAASIDYGPLAEWIGFHLRLAQAAAFQAFARKVHAGDLSPGRFATLTLIGRNPGISQTALSRANGRDKSSLTPVLEDLVRRRLVRRARGKDRRAYRLTLTPAGERALQKMTEAARRHELDLDRIVGARRRTEFLRALRKIAKEIA